MGTWSIALLACTLGVTVRAWAVCHCNYGQGLKKALATTGPYAYVRNPLYIGNLLIIAGAMAASELAWLLPAGMAWSYLIYSLAMVHEERRLEAKYGMAFMRYRSQVPAWIPRFKMGNRPLSAMLMRYRNQIPVSMPTLKEDSRPRNSILHQTVGYLILLPFIVKELKLLGLWLA